MGAALTRMAEKSEIILQITAAFGGNPYPGDPFLQGSQEGCEPVEEGGSFVGGQSWQTLEASFLDAQAGALSFFSEAGFRFYLPAYLIADLNGQQLTI